MSLHSYTLHHTVLVNRSMVLLQPLTRMFYLVFRIEFGTSVRRTYGSCDFRQFGLFWDSFLLVIQMRVCACVFVVRIRSTSA